MKTQITSNPLDGEWVEQAARLYVSRYHSHLDYRSEADRNLERIRVSSCIRECLPAPERIDAQVPPALGAWQKAEALRTYDHQPLPKGDRLHA